MKISVIVPTYKPQAYLWECLDSIYNQTFPKSDYELVLVLNGCNEPYNAQIKEWLSKHSDLQVQYFQTDEGGVSNARNIALDNAKGEYVTFIDDDDYVSEAYLSDLYQYSTQNIVSISDAVSFDDITKVVEKNNILHRDFVSRNSSSLYNIYSVKKFYGAPVRKLVSRNIIGNRRFDIRFRNGEDTLFFFLISDRVYKTRPSSGAAVYYRRCRPTSAHFTKKTRKEKVTLGFNLIGTLSSYYFRNPKHYNFLFYLTRVMGAIKNMIS